MSGLFGCVDEEKAKRALLGYRLRWYFVIVVSFIINFLVLSVVLPARIGYVAVMLYMLMVVFIIFLNELELLVRYKHPLSAEFSQPMTPEHRCYTVLWENLCMNAGFCSGGVYVVSPPDPLRRLEYLHTFGVSHQLFFSKERRLFIREEMLGKFTMLQIRAILLHECGHLRWMPLTVRYALVVVTLPANMILAVVASLRHMVSQPHIAGALLFMERTLYFASIFHAAQSEEYAADAYAAQQMGTAKHIIDVLLKLEGEMLIQIVDAERRITVATWEKNVHLHTHPLIIDRVSHLRSLHNDRPRETTSL